MTPVSSVEVPLGESNREDAGKVSAKAYPYPTGGQSPDPNRDFVEDLQAPNKEGDDES